MEPEEIIISMPSSKTFSMECYERGTLARVVAERDALRAQVAAAQKALRLWRAGVYGEAMQRLCEAAGEASK